MFFITNHANKLASVGVGNYTPTSEAKILIDNLLKILEVTINILKKLMINT